MLWIICWLTSKQENKRNSVWGRFVQRRPQNNRHMIAVMFYNSKPVTGKQFRMEGNMAEGTCKRHGKRPDKRKFSFFQHVNCEFFPCHKVDEPEHFNCLFCYCPLYTLGSACGGNYIWLPDGTKDCGGCLIPHSRGSFDYIVSKFQEISDLTKKNR